MQQGESWRKVYDYRQDHEYGCSTKDFRRPATGVDHLKHSWIPFQENPVGEVIMNLTLRPSTDCSRNVPNGYVSMNGKRGNMDTVQDISDSSRKMAKKSTHAVRNALTIQTGKVDFGIKTGKSDDFFQSHQSRKFNQYLITHIEQIEGTFIISEISPPKLVDSVITLLRDHIQSRTQQQDDQFLTNVLLKHYPTFLTKAIIGESYGRVRTHVSLGGGG